MKEFFSGKKLKILSCLLAFLLGFLMYVFVSGNSATFPEKLFRFVASPFVKVANGLSDWSKEKADAIANSKRYKEENEALRAQISSMFADVLKKAALEDENDDLKNLLKLSQTYVDYDWTPPASILSRKANDIFGNFTINMGENENIKSGDPVFDEIGLIGKIGKVGDNFSDVVTILSPDFKVAVQTASTDDRDAVFGVLENSIEYSEKDRILVSFSDKTSEIKIGDKIMTAEDSIYPAGILIGSVTEVFTAPSGLYRVAVVDPETDVFSVNKAFVIRLNR